jgi:uncharacterized protein YciI
MNDRVRRLCTALLAGVLAASTLLPALTFADDAAAAANPKPLQFLYVLRLTPAYQDESKWTEAANAVVSEHFKRLSKATEDGKVILAGKTSEPLDQTFGLVVFEADSEAEAREFMNSDPAVVAGVMTATLHPYSVALLRKQ